MKTLLLLSSILLFITGPPTFAQNPVLLGMTANGGANNGGVIFKINYDGSAFKVLYSFVSATGRNPYGNLTRASNGLFYGTADSGGTKKGGVIFSFDTVTNIYTVVHNFSRTDGGGYYSGCSLLQASDGKLYGMTGAGGANNLGVLFKFNPANNNYTKLIDFNGTNGARPYHNSLMQASNGLLYGMTINGGLNNYGVLFSLNLINNTYYSYDMPNQGSWYPNGNLLEASDGKLYGTTTTRYEPVCLVEEGTIRSFNPATNILAFVYDFRGSCASGRPYGAYPYGSLIEQSTGVFYGMNSGDAAYSLPANIFKYQSSNGGVTEVFDFNSTVSNGSLPYGSLITGNDGNLFGMTWEGGASNKGVIFRFNPSNNSYFKIHDFDRLHGANPYADLITCILPKQPGDIAGVAADCYGSTQTYSISPVAGATSYKWTVPPGASIQGSAKGTIITVLFGSTGGSITVKAKNVCGLSQARSKSILIHACTSTTNQFAIESKAEISPNPTHGGITIQFKSAAKDNYSVKVIGIVGNMILNKQSIAEPGLNTIHLDLSKFAKGVYTVQLQAGNTRTFIKKIVLQ